MPIVGDMYDIEARVREIDPRLVVLFDYAEELYVVYEKVRKQRLEASLSNGTPVYALVDELSHVTTVQENDGSFRPLDARLLIDLHHMDMHSNEKWYDELRQKARRIREAAKRDRDDHMKQVIKHYTPLVRKELRYGL